MKRLLSVLVFATSCATAPQTPQTPRTPQPPLSRQPRASAAVGHDGYRNVRPYQLEARRLSGRMSRLPAAVRRRLGCSPGIWMGKIYVGRDGAVARISTITPLPGADAGIVANLATWRYQPLPVPMATVMRFIWDPPCR